MTYHMERMCMRGRRGRGTRHDYMVDMPWMGDFTRKIRFPQKLYDVINNGSKLITWNAPGTGIIVNEENFEDRIMIDHPGLVQISTFANFRRQLRWYGFEWEAIDREGNFQFEHPSFLLDSPDLVESITTKKKGVPDVDSYTHLHLRQSSARVVSRCSSKTTNKQISKPKPIHAVTERGAYKPRGRRGRPRKIRSGDNLTPVTYPTPNTASPSNLPDSDCELDEAELDRVAAALSENPIHDESTSLMGSTGDSASQEFPSSTGMYSSQSVGHGHSYRSQSSRGRCWRSNPDRNHCCHCCCHCCCCEHRDDWWQYCRPWMQQEQHKYEPYSPQEDEFAQQSPTFSYPSLSYYTEVPQYHVNMSDPNQEPINPVPPPPAQLGTAPPVPLGTPVQMSTPLKLETAAQDMTITSGQPVEYVLYGQPQLYQADSSITSPKDQTPQNQLDDNNNSLATL